VYDHIDGPLTLAAIADAVGSSPSGLQRVFDAMAGQSPGSFVRKLRMEYALRSLQDRKRSVIEVALAAGFSDHAAFTRSFRRVFGFAPRDARERRDIVRELDHVSLEEPDFVDLGACHAKLVTESGRYFECAPRAWQRLAQLVGESTGVDASTDLFVGITHDNPHASSDEPRDIQVRFSAGVLAAPGPGTTPLPSGAHARFRFRGLLHNSGLALHYIYGHWALQAEVRIAVDRPCMFLLECLPSSASEQELQILVPLEAA
jgi:AraC-like DNA-binding protein/DNA gyrase inhibitor GyrI